MEGDGLDSGDGCDGDDVPEVARNQVGGEQVEVIAAVGFLAGANAAHDGDVVGAIGRADRDALYLNARDAAGGVNEQVV